MKILVTERYIYKYIKELEGLGYDVIYKSESKAVVDKEIEDVDILIGYNPFETLDISKLKKLKYIQLTSIGIDQVPKDKVLKQNILMCNNKGGYSIPIAEYIVMYILNIYKNTKSVYENKINKIWQVDTSLEELTDKKVGFIGTGTIAQNTAKRLKAFDMKIYGINTNGRDIEYFDKCFSIDNMQYIFKECDIVIATVPSTKDTIKMIDDSKFTLMKQDSIFINVGRGNIVNEKDLINNIDKFKGVALDVFEVEPLPKDNPLWEYENVIITSHNSWISNRNKERIFKSIYENLERYKNGEKLINIVDIERGY